MVVGQILATLDLDGHGWLDLYATRHSRFERSKARTAAYGVPDNCGPIPAAVTEVRT